MSLLLIACNRPNVPRTPKWQTHTNSLLLHFHESSKMPQNCYIFLQSLPEPPSSKIKPAEKMLLPLRTFWMALALAICSLFLSSSMGTPAEDFQMASPLCRHFQGLEACQPGAAPEKRKSTYMRFGKRKSAYMRFGKRAMAEEPLAVAYEQNFEEPSAAMEKRKSAYMRFGKRKSAYMRFGRK